MPKPTLNAHDAVQRIREVLADLLETGGDARLPVAEILRLIGVIEAALDAVRPRHPVPKAGQSRKPEKQYLIEAGRRGEVLVEYEPGHAQTTGSYRCPSAVYEALASVLAASEEPCEFEELMGKLRERMQDKPGDYQARVALRFWMQAHPPMVSRARSKYRPASAGDSFLTSANALWQKTKRASGRRVADR